MSLGKRYIQLCEALHRRGLRCELTPGAIIARGFADLGHEKFCVLNPPQIVSLYTGNVSTVAEEQRGFFFWMPAVDDLVDCIQREGYDLVGLNFEKQREWKVQIRNADSVKLLEFSEPTLELSLGSALLHCLRGPDVSDPS